MRPAEVRSGSTSAGRAADHEADTAGGWAAARYAQARIASARILGIAGVAAYNWGLLVPLKPGVMTSPDELFSNLEVTGRPYATGMQHADIAAGLLLVAAFWAAGHSTSLAGRREWLSMLGFAIALAGHPTRLRWHAVTGVALAVLLLIHTARRWSRLRRSRVR